MTYISWFGLISWRLFDVWTSLFGIMNQYDPTFDLNINVGHCDIYFMVQWFCITSWRLFDVWTSYFGIMGQYDPDVWRKNKFRSVWPIFHVPVRLNYISNTIWCVSVIFSDNETVWPKLWSQSKYKSALSIFHGLVIFSRFLDGWIL